MRASISFCFLHFSSCCLLSYIWSFLELGLADGSKTELCNWSCASKKSGSLSFITIVCFKFSLEGCASVLTRWDSFLRESCCRWIRSGYFANSSWNKWTFYVRFVSFSRKKFFSSSSSELVLLLIIRFGESDCFLKKSGEPVSGL